MDYSQIYSDLKNEFPNLEIHQNHSLAPYTTINIGGPADIFIHTKTSAEFINTLKFLNSINNFQERSECEEQSDEPEGSEHRQNLFIKNIVILGNGSNVLISDSGIRGIVIKNSSQNIEILNKIESTEPNDSKIDTHRTENDPNNYLNFSTLDYDESEYPQVQVKIEAGVSLPYSINYLFNQGITGLQWFAYIPGTIGGAVCSNIHGGKYHISDFINNIEVFDLQTAEINILNKNDLDWDYDFSYFQTHSNLIIVSVTLNLFLGDINRARQTAAEWIKQKTNVQSPNSIGSVFKNPDLKDCLPIWDEQKSAGWIIDHELNIKGKSIGDAQISPKHANFIINNGKATATDYLNLVKFIQTEFEKHYHFNLELEIKLLGKFN